MKKNLIDFSKSNPQLKVVTSVVPNRHPILIGEYSTPDFLFVIARKWSFKTNLCKKYESKGHLGTRSVWLLDIRIGDGIEKYKWT